MSNEHIHILPEYANSEHLTHERYEREIESTVTYPGEDIDITLSETNSLVEDKYCLTLVSAKLIVEGSDEEQKTKNVKRCNRIP